MKPSIYLAENRAVKLASVLTSAFPDAKDARVAVAFMKQSGLTLVEKGLHECLDKGGRVEFLVGLDFRLTEARALFKLVKLQETYPSINLFCYSNPFVDDTPVYHPKLYVFNKGDEAIGIVGSSNLTAGGLRQNIELNVIIQLDSDDELLSNIYEIYNGYKFQPGRFAPDEGFIQNYDEVCRKLKRREKEALKEKDVADVLKELEHKQASLPRPKVSPSDLFGWQKMIFQLLPEGRFRTSDIYKFEARFAEAYPENRHIRAKVRQVLQQLRDLGLIRHHQVNLWEK